MTLRDGNGTCRASTPIYLRNIFKRSHMAAKKPKKHEIAQQFFSQHCSNSCLRVLEVGGTELTDHIVREIIGDCELLKLNIQSSSLGKGPDCIVGDGTKMPLKDDSIDAILCFDVIEHIVEPDYLITEAHRVLKKGGFLMITTANLATIYNRILLFLGYSPLTYSPAGYRVGLPFPPVKWDLGHKSVFTYKGLRDLLSVYQFETVKSAGFCYYEPFYTEHERREVGFFRLRMAIDKILPKEMREGMIFLSKKT